MANINHPDERIPGDRDGVLDTLEDEHKFIRNCAFDVFYYFKLYPYIQSAVNETVELQKYYATLNHAIAINKQGQFLTYNEHGELLNATIRAQNVVLAYVELLEWGEEEIKKRRKEAEEVMEKLFSKHNPPTEQP